MRILIAGRGFPVDERYLSGVEAVSAAHARALSARGHEVRVARFGPRRTRELGELSGGVRSFLLPLLPGALSTFMCANDIQLVHFHGGFVPEHALAARSLTCPYIVSPHGAYQPWPLANRRALRKRVYRRLLDRRFIDEASALQALTWAEQEAIGKLYPGKRISLIPNFVHRAEPIRDAERAAARRALGIADDERCLLYLGRLDVSIKGLDLLVEAFVRARAREPKLRLVLAGPLETEAPRREPRANRIISGVDGISLHGAAHGFRKRELHAACDIYCQTSRSEGMPQGVLEALALGVPVLATRVTGVGEFLEEHPLAGSVIAEPTVESITAGILAGGWVLGERRRRELALAAQHVFSLDRVAELLEELYTSVLSAS